MRLMYGTLLFYLAALVLDVSYFMISHHRLGTAPVDVTPVLSYASEAEQPVAYRVSVSFAKSDNLAREQVMQAFNALSAAQIEGEACLSCTLQSCEMDVFGWSQQKYALARRFVDLVETHSNGELHSVFMLMTDKVASL